MARRERLSPELQLACEAKITEGKTLREISKWLLDEHNVSYSYVSLSRLIKRKSETRKEMADAIIKPFMEKTLASDLELLENSLAELREIIKKAKKPLDKLRAYDRLDKFLKLSFKVKGITLPSAQDNIDEERDFEQLMKDLRLQGVFDKPEEPKDE